ncbi:MAG: hypothetical protein WBJ13_06640, partial [Sedimentibacter sp.]
MKKIIIAIFVLILVFSLAACNTDSLEEYKKAAEKTEQITKGKASGEFSMITEFNTEGMTAEEIAELNYYKDMNGSFNASFDNDVEKGIYRTYLNMAGLGFDFDLYMNKDEMFMKLPVVGKFMKLDKTQDPFNMEQKEETNDIISKETLESITSKWIGLMKEEDVFKGKNIVLTTPDGEVKTTEYVIKLNDEQIKTLVSEIIDIILKDEDFKEFFQEYIKENLKTEKNKTYENMLGDLKNDIDKYEVESFSYTAYVDIDGYIVNEMIEFSLKVINPENAG